MTSSTNPKLRKQERQHLRFAVSWAAEVQTAPGRSLSLRVVDISQGGIGVLSDDMLPAAGMFSVTLRVPSPHHPGQISSVIVQARLVYQVFTAGRNRAGLEFIQIRPADIALLMSCAQKRV